MGILSKLVNNTTVYHTNRSPPTLLTFHIIELDSWQISLWQQKHWYRPWWEHQWLLRSFSWMMMTASLWLMEMLTPSGCVLFTTKLIVKFSACSGSLSSTITILKQPVLFLNKTVALTISKSFSAAVSEIKRTKVWKTQGYILLLQANVNYISGTYCLNYFNKDPVSLLKIFDRVYIILT